MKKICRDYEIPTAKFKLVKKFKELIKSIKNFSFPVVIKADGLAAGKGVTICKSRQQVFKVSVEIFTGKFKSFKKLVIEEFLDGKKQVIFVDKKIS